MELTPSQQKKLNKIDKIEKALQGNVVSVFEHVDTVESDLQKSIDDLKDTIEAFDIPERLTEQELIDVITPLIPEPLKGDDYVLTEDDKQEIADLIDVPVVEKVIEKTTETIVREQPIEIIKEVAVLDVDGLPQYGDKFRDGLELLQGDERLDIKAIKGIEDYDEVSRLAKASQFMNRGGNGKGLLSQQNDVNIVDPTNGEGLVYNSTTGKWENGTGGGIQSIVAGTNIAVDDTDPANPIVSATGFVTGATDTTLTQTGSTLGLNLSNANTWLAAQTFNKADSSTIVPAPSNLAINFTPDGSGFYAGGTTYSCIIYSYTGSVYDIVGTSNSTTDPNDSNYYYVDLSWDSAGSVDGYFVYDSVNSQYIDVGSSLSYQITPSTSWTGGTPPSSPSSIVTPQNSLTSQGDKDASTQDINVFEFSSTPLRLYWDYASQYLKFEASDTTLQTLRTNINADSIYSSSYTGAWSGSAIGTNYGGTGLTSWTQGDIPYYISGTSLSKLAKNTSATRYLSNTGTNNAPAWSQINLANGVTGDLPFANLTQIAARSVLGVTGNATADVAAITAGTDHQVLRRSGTSLAFGSLNLAQSAAVTGILPIANGGTGNTNIYGTANTWTAAQTIQVGTNADGVFQIKNAAGSNRFGYSTSKDQLSVGDAGYNSSAGFFYIYDVTHSFKDVFTIIKGTWGSAFDIQIATLSPVVKATGGSTFVSYTQNDVGTYLYNAAVTGSTFNIRNDTDNYGTWGFYAKGYNNNSAPSSAGVQKRAVSYGVVGEAQSNATGFGGAGLRSYSASANIDGVRVDVLSGQTAPLFRARLVDSFYDALMTTATDLMTIDAKGGINPASMADGSANNNSIYYSTTASKLVYKDSGGTVNALY